MQFTFKGLKANITLFVGAKAKHYFIISKD